MMFASPNDVGKPNDVGFAKCKRSYSVKRIDQMKENKLAEAAELNDKLLPLANACFIEVNPIPVKEAARLLGYNVGVPRAPLTVMEDNNREKLIAAMKAYNLEIKA